MHILVCICKSLLAITLISCFDKFLYQVPINIPAFAVSSNVDVDMNVELMAHGFSNGIVGVIGGMCFSDFKADLCC